MENLTKKEQLAVEYFLAGDNRTEAVFKAYECNSRESAGAMASKIFQKERIRNELAKRQVMLQQKLSDKNLRMVEIIEKYVPREAIAKKIADNIMSSDKRVSDSAIEKYLKIAGEYAPEKMLALVRGDIVSERDRLLIKPE